MWNYCNELQITMFNRELRFLSGYDFAKFTRGATKEGLHLHSQTLDAYAIRAGNLCEDARGRWYLNACVAVPVAEPTDRPSVRRDLGIDLGLEDLVATSDGEKVSAPQFYRGLEPKLAIAQRAGRKDRVRAIHAKIANRRRDSLHQFSTRLVRAYDIIFVGNVSAAALVKTPHAKSVLDASWSAFGWLSRLDRIRPVPQITSK
jgi:putative transposase